MTRTKAWGFPRWGDYGREQEPQKVRICDHAGCDQPGQHQAPKSAYSDEKWWFCLEHATEYNKNWNYFAGLTPEEAARLAKEEELKSKGYRRAHTWDWASEGGKYGSSAATQNALDTLELEEGASPEDIKRAYRLLAKRYHPDTNPGDREAAQRFQEVRAAYDFLIATQAAG